MTERIEFLAIGDELLDGRLADTNVLRLAELLGEVGLSLAARTTVRDDKNEIMRAATMIADRGTELCIVSGGLGPTSDDLTSEAFADLIGVELMRDGEQARLIEERLRRFGRPLTENQLKQADRPTGAELLANPDGTAPGFSLSLGSTRFVAVPGVPREFEGMVERAVIASRRGTQDLVHYFSVFGLSEGGVDDRLKTITSEWPGVKLSFRARMPTITVGLRAQYDAREALTCAVEFVRSQLGIHIFAEDDRPLAAVVLDLLRERDATVATAESCTGGLVGDLLTDIPGSSDVFRLGAVTYSNEAKVQMVGVSQQTLLDHGAVSEQTVLEMAKGVRQSAQTTYGLAASGIAGPGGGTKDKPVGTVWIALAGPAGSESRLLSLPFDRRRNKIISAYSVLDLLRRKLVS